MTQSPSESGIAKQALHAVSALIADAGPAPEGIVNTYGEDLLVQTSHGFQMDASRLWVQVKGTAEIDRFRLKSGGFRVTIPFDRAMRWIRTLDLVLMVLWDTVENVGWYALPASQVDPIRGVNSGQKSVTIRFGEDDILTKEAVDRLVWRSRLEHYRLLALSARDAQSIREEEEQGKKKKSQAHERVLTAMDFTDLLEITERRLEPGGLKYRVRDEIWDEFQETLDGTPDTYDGWQRLQKKIAYEIVCRRWEMIEPNLDLPSVLIEEGAEIIIYTMNQGIDGPELIQAALAWASQHKMP